jgi:hypothetical protein
MSHLSSLWDYILVWRMVSTTSRRTWVLMLMLCIFPRRAAVSLMRNKPGLIRTSASAAAVYLDVRFEWMVTTIYGHTVVVVVMVMVMEVLPGHLAIVVGISSGYMAHWAVVVTVLEDIFLVLSGYVWFRRIKTFPSCRGVSPEIPSSLWSVF